MTLEQLEEIYGDHIVKKQGLTNAFCKDYSKVKAIVLGSDPTVSKINELSEEKYLCSAFALDAKDDDVVKAAYDGRRMNFWDSTIGCNICELGLTMEELYVQNLCKFSLKHETSWYWKTKSGDKKHEGRKRIWIQIAKSQVASLTSELDSLFSKKIPVLLTSGYLLEPLVTDLELLQYTADHYYQDNLFIADDKNCLGRTLILMSRHNAYRLKNYPKYCNEIKKRFR